MADKSNGKINGMGRTVSMSVYETGSILAEGKLKGGRFQGPVRMFAQVNEL